MSVVFMMVYTKLSVTKSKAFIFYSMHAFFMILYGCIMVAYAFKDQLQPERGSLETTYPSTFKPIATMFENWIIVLVFIFGEMYGSIILSLMFWGFSNDICTVDESKRFYPLIGLTGNVALVMLGIFLYSNMHRNYLGCIKRLSKGEKGIVPAARLGDGNSTRVRYGEHLQLDAKECSD
jgi:AAA family ATP:ADP antiporter